MVEPAHTQLRFGLELWGFEFPAFYQELSEANRGEGWARRVDLGVILYTDWMFQSDWHLGVVLSALRSTVSRDGFEQDGSFWSVEALGRVGYRWMPMGERGLVINPWLGAGPLYAVSEPPRIGQERYEELPIQVIGTLHVGWRF